MASETLHAFIVESPSDGSPPFEGATLQHMWRLSRRCLVPLSLASLLSACTTATDEPEATVTPQPTPTATATAEPVEEPTIEEFAIPDGSRPHDVAPAPDGTVWYTAQGSGELGRLVPSDGSTNHVDLGAGSRPHGVIVGPDDAAWVTDGGLNAIVRVDPETEEVRTFPLPEDAPDANLNTATFDGNGVLWFTGQAGVYGRLDPAEGTVETFDAPGGRGPLRDRDDLGRRRLLRVPGGEPHRADRHRDG